LQPGDAVDILGPLGNRFDLPPANGTALLVGGGVGIPPMIYLAERLAGRSAVAFAGAVTRTLLPLTITDDQPVTEEVEPMLNVQEFAHYGIPAVITTDDGSMGIRGFVTMALERYLEQHCRSHTVIFTCGPEPMMKRVAAIAMQHEVECQVAVERAMACGMGTCQSCCIKVKKPDATKPPLAGSDWCYRLACTDGPIFKAADLLW
jgi:dihydroorotate dehydrogenase electron transfer subunit